MQRQISLIKVSFLTFIIGGLFFNFVFAQGGNPKDRQKEGISQMLDLLEGKDIEGGQGDDLDFLLDELAENDGFMPLRLEEAGALNDSEKLLGLEEEVQAQEEESSGGMYSLREEVFSLQDELKRVHEKNDSLKGDVKHLRKKLATRRQHLSKEAAAQIYQELGTAYTQAKVYAQAIEAYIIALKLDPRNPKAHHDLGLLYEHFLGDSKKAIYHLRQYLKLSSDFKDRERVAHLIRIIKKEDIRDGAMR